MLLLMDCQVAGIWTMLELQQQSNVQYHHKEKSKKYDHLVLGPASGEGLPYHLQCADFHIVFVMVDFVIKFFRTTLIMLVVLELIVSNSSKWSLFLLSSLITSGLVFLFHFILFFFFFLLNYVTSNL